MGATSVKNSRLPASQLGGVLDFMKNIMFSQVVNSQTSVRVIFVNSCPLLSERQNSLSCAENMDDDFTVKSELQRDPPRSKQSVETIKNGPGADCFVHMSRAGNQ